MKKEKIIALLLAATMAIGGSLTAFAQDPVKEVPMDITGTEDAGIMPMIVDTTAPVLKSVTLSSETVSAGGTLTVTVNAEDELTGVTNWQATFVNKETKKQLTTYSQKYPAAGILETSEYEPTGIYELESVVLEDKAGNSVWYEKNPGGWEPGDNSIIKQLELEVSFTITNDNQVDSQAPELKNITIDRDSVKAGESLTVTVDAEDELTGVTNWQATFVNKETKKQLTTYSQKYPAAGILETSEYEPTGIYELESVVLEDKAGNSVWYEKNPGGWEPGDNSIIKQLELEVSFTITNDNQVDSQAPELKNITIDRDSVKAGESLTVTVDAEDELTGVTNWQATFVNKETKKQLTTYSQKYPAAGILETSEYEPTGIYELESVVLEDKAENSVWYEKNPGGWESGDDSIIKQLELEVSFTVINDDKGTPTPTPTPDPKPEKPSRPDEDTSSGYGDGVHYGSEDTVSRISSKNSVSVVKNRNAKKEKDFWNRIEKRVNVVKDGYYLKIKVPSYVTKMPVSVMETIRKENVKVVFSWNKKTITIPAGKAMPKEKLRNYWSFKTLDEIYNGIPMTPITKLAKKISK